MTKHLTVVPDGYIPIYTYEDYMKIDTYTITNVNNIKVVQEKFILMNDLDIGDRKPFNSIQFEGVFDGNNYSIFVDAKPEYVINGTSYGFALFQNSRSGTLKNINLIIRSFQIVLPKVAYSYQINFISGAGRYTKFINCHVSVLVDIEITQQAEINGIVSNGEDGSYLDCSFTAKNIKLTNSNSNFYGVSNYIDNSTIENVTVKAIVDNRGWTTAGITSSSGDCIFKNCHFEGVIKGVSTVGGFDTSGYNSTYTDCSVKGDVVGEGGTITGLSYGSNCTYVNCRFEGTLLGLGASSSTQIGLISVNGYNCSFTNCHAIADIEGRSQVGGISGYGSGSNFIDCTFKGTLRSRINTSRVGAISIYAHQIQNCHVEATIRGGGKIGGVVSEMDDELTAYISNSSFKGSINGKLNDDSTAIASIIAPITTLIEGGYIEKCFADQCILENATEIGGLVVIGLIGEIRNSYSKATIKHATKSGGLVAKCNDGYGTVPDIKITNSYYSGRINTENNGLFGNFAPENPITITSSYYNEDKIGTLPTTPKGEAKSSQEMKAQLTFVNWDFNNIWNIFEGLTFPYLFSEATKVKCRALPI